MIKHNDPMKLWEQDGDIELMRNFFGKLTEAESGEKDKIKQMVLAKLAEDQGQETETNIKVNEEVAAEVPESQFLRIPKTLWTQSKIRVKNSWQRWRWKMALPAVALILFIVIGQTGILRNGILPLAQSKSDSPSLGMAASSEPAAMDSAKTEATREYSSQQEAKGPEMNYDMAVRNSGNAVSIAPPIAPPMPGPEPEAPPADASLPRKITHNLYATLQVEDVELAVERLNNLAKSLGGYIVDSQIDNNQQNNAYGSMTIKIPADQFEGARSDLKEIGKILNQHVKADDITNQYYDAETRLRNWRAEEERYLEILKRADTVSDIIMVENSLSNIRMQIEQLKGQLKLWDHEVAYSTIQVQLQTKPSPVSVDEPWQPMAFSETWEATQKAVLKTISTLWNAFNYLVVALGYAFPLIILGGGGYFVYRQWRRRKG